MNKPKSVDMKVLFIGNSYTYQVTPTLEEMAAHAGYTNSTFTRITEGGATLSRHINKGRAAAELQKGGWDIVVLQEQSLSPALPGTPNQSFNTSVDTLVKQIRDAGAEPILYMTWGRIDGYARRKDVLPDYQTMQDRLSKAYREAADRNKIRVAPVGEAWALVRKKDDKLGRELYRGDGSHPSTKGAYIASCVFLRTFFNDSLENTGVPQGMSEKECNLIKGIVSGMPIPAR